MVNSYYNENELSQIGFKSYGKNVKISKLCSIYGADNIIIGNNVRIDDFCILSGKIKIGDFVHISAYNALYGRYGIEIGNFCGISPKSIIYSATDDFSGEHMISPMVPEKYTKLYTGKVTLEDFVQIGSNSIIMPNITIYEGACTGAFCFVNKSLKPWNIYIGIPARVLKERKKNIKELSKEI